MRLRVLPLPSEVAGEHVREPFLLILDEVTDDEVTAVLAAQIKDATPAAGCLVFKASVDLPAVD